MSSLTASEAFEILRFAQQYVPRLEQAGDLLEKQEALEAERSWIAQAIDRLNTALASAPEALERARALPDLADTIQALASEDQGRWVDTLEKLVAGITFTASSRSPLIESLLPNQKWPALRRASREDVTRYQAEFERRAKTGYVTRMLASEDMAVVRPVLDQVTAAYARWMACFSPAPLSDEEAQAIRAELRGTAETVERVLRQSRLLAEAALLGTEGALEELGLHAKPKKRATRGDLAAELAMMAESIESGAEDSQTSEEALASEAEEAAELAAPGAEAAESEVGAAAQLQDAGAVPKKRGKKAVENPGESPAAGDAPPRKTRKKRANSSEPGVAASGDETAEGADPVKGATAPEAELDASAEKGTGSAEPSTAAAPEAGPVAAAENASGTDDPSATAQAEAADAKSRPSAEV